MSEKNSIEKEIGKVLSNIRKFRELRNMTRDQLAADLGLSASGYSKIERGEIELTVSRLYQIAAALDVTAQQILEFDVSKVLGSSASEGHENDEGPKISSFHNDVMYKYIEKLEDENLRLKTELTSMRGDLPYEKPNHPLRKDQRF
jgi:transcriptional regulator with XRE-family HTH domain